MVLPCARARVSERACVHEGAVKVSNTFISVGILYYTQWNADISRLLRSYYFSCKKYSCRFVAERSAADGLLGLRVRIPPGAWMFVLCVCCTVKD